MCVGVGGCGSKREVKSLIPESGYGLFTDIKLGDLSPVA